MQNSTCFYPMHNMDHFNYNNYNNAKCYDNYNYYTPNNLQRQHFYRQEKLQEYTPPKYYINNKSKLISYNNNGNYQYVKPLMADKPPKKPPTHTPFYVPKPPNFTWAKYPTPPMSPTKNTSPPLSPISVDSNYSGNIMSYDEDYHQSIKEHRPMTESKPKPKPMDYSHTSSVRQDTYYRLLWGDDEESVNGGLKDNTASGGGARQDQQEEELDTRMLQIQSKRFYLDVKQNWRGRFIKLAEVGAGGRKSRLLMSMSAAAEFRDRLGEFNEFYNNLPPQPQGPIDQQDGQLKSEVMIKENRRYYIDLKQNNRGRFLRVTQSLFRGPRSVIVLPAQGIIELRNALSTLIDKWASEDDLNENAGFRGDLPEPRQIRVENKIFYFDVGQNNRGVFMRVSEVKNNFRTAITIPERSWSRFRDIFVEMCDKMAEQQPAPLADDKSSDH